MTMFKSVLVCLAGVGVALAFLGCGPTKLERIESEWARDKTYLAKSKEMLEQAQNDLVDAKKALTAETVRVQGLQGQLKTAEAEKDGLKAEITKLGKAGDAAARETQAAQQAVKKLQVELVKQARLEAAYRKEAARLKTTITDLQKKIRQLEAQIAELKKEPATTAQPEE